MGAGNARKTKLAVYSNSINIESVVKDGLILNYIPACVVHTHTYVLRIAKLYRKSLHYNVPAPCT